MRKYVIIIICWVSFGSCAKHFRLAKDEPNALQSQSITLDSTYDYYIRELHTAEMNDKFRIQGNFSANKTVNKKLIEVEYLLVSREHQNVIYLSTIPDKHMRYYADRNLGENLINVYDVKKICFGKIDKQGRFFFTTKKTRKKRVDTWSVDIQQREDANYLFIETISVEVDSTFENMMPVGQALQKDLNFKKVMGYKIAFRSRQANDTAYLRYQRIGINPFDKKYMIQFSLDREVILKKSKGTEIYFGHKRSPFKHEDLLDHR